MAVAACTVPPKPPAPLCTVMPAPMVSVCPALRFAAKALLEWMPANTTSPLPPRVWLSPVKYSVEAPLVWLSSTRWPLSSVSPLRTSNVDALLTITSVSSVTPSSTPALECATSNPPPPTVRTVPPWIVPPDSEIV